MLKQIDFCHIQAGRKIVDLRVFSDSIYMVFDDQTFAAFESRMCYDATYLDNITVSVESIFGIGGYDVDTCVELGIITQEEYDEAERQQKEYESKRQVEYWKKEHERLGKLIAEVETQRSPALDKIADRLLADTWEVYGSPPKNEDEWFALCDKITGDGATLARVYLQKEK